MPRTSNQEKTTTGRRLQGIVVKTASSKTATVRIDRLLRHRRLKRVIRRSRKYLVHDEKGLARIGDTVAIEETRPLSKRKRWQVAEVIREAPRTEVEEDEVDEGSRPASDSE